MAKIKYDVKNVEGSTDFDPPKPGVYTAKVHEATFGKSSNKNDMLTVVFEITKGDEKGKRVWHYIVTEEGDEMGARRLKQLVTALGKKAAGTLDTDKMVGEEVQILTGIRKDNREDADEDAVFGTVRKVMSLAEGEEDEPEEDDEDGAEEGAEDESGDDDEEDEEDEDEEDEDEDDDEDAIDLDELDRKQLKALIKEQELDITVKKSWSDDDLREKIAEALGGGDDEDGDNYDDLSADDLKKELKKRELATTGNKAKMIARLRKDDESEPF